MGRGYISDFLVGVWQPAAGLAGVSLMAPLGAQGTLADAGGVAPPGDGGQAPAAPAAEAPEAAAPATAAPATAAPATVAPEAAAPEAAAPEAAAPAAAQPETAQPETATPTRPEAGTEVAAATPEPVAEPAANRAPCGR